MTGHLVTKEYTFKVEDDDGFEYNVKLSISDGNEELTVFDHHGCKKYYKGSLFKSIDRWIGDNLSHLLEDFYY